MQTAPPNQKDLKLVTVTTSYDIRRVIQEFIQPPKTDSISTEFEALDESGKKFKKVLTMSVEGDYRTLLIKGLTTIRNRMEAIQKFGDVGRKVFNIDGHSWVDDLIARRLGGKRDGLRVRWDLSEGTYFFDPFTGKLTKLDNGQK